MALSSYKMESLIRRILKDIIARLQHIESIISLTLVGSLQSRFHRFTTLDELYNDIDIVIILRQILNEDYKAIADIFNDIAEKYSTRTTQIAYETRIGPLRHHMKNKKVIALHQLLFWVDSYINYCKINHLTPYSWQQCEPIYGLPLTDIMTLDKPTKYDVLESRSGINHYISMIEKQEIIALVIRKVNHDYNHLPVPVEVSGANYIDLMYNAVLKCSGNVIRLFEDIDIHDEDKIVNRFYEKFQNFALCDLPKQILSQKRRMRRMGLRIEKEIISDTCQEVLGFLTALRIYVQEEIKTKKK